MLIANRLAVPDDTRALLWDMDGVLLDTLTMDYELVNRLLSVHTAAEVPRRVIEEYFPYDIPRFWQLLLSRVGLEVSADVFDELVRGHGKARESSDIAVHDGVAEILAEAKDRGLQAAVVSNNPAADVERMLMTAGLLDHFSVVVGNDDPGIAKKPAPDSYLEAARRLGSPTPCVALEDSLLGAQAANAAGCWTVGIATGATDFDTLSASPYVDRCYENFAPCQIALGWEGVTKKSLATPNEFVSHMIEHIAWRLGCSVDVAWTNDDWNHLGREMGSRITGLCHLQGTAAAFGMIDDGSCEVTLRCDGTGDVRLRAARQVDLEWFLGLRCEQLANGQPLVSMLHGLAAGCRMDLEIFVASAEDPHHTWEGIFRGVGIGLRKLADAGESVLPSETALAAERESSPVQWSQSQAPVEQGWDIRQSSAKRAKLRRETAESVVDIELELGTPSAECSLAVSDSINVAGITDFLREFAVAGNVRIAVGFNATRLSSSHVVTEDIGLALGRALRCIAVERMVGFGINGAGSNIGSVEDLTSKTIRVGVSLEGRKFWKFVPLSSDYTNLRKRFLVGHTLPNGLYSEDLDDFIDGFAGGLGASVMVHVGPDVDPVSGWPSVFSGLGAAVQELLTPNPDRKALAPGVKATLA
jgi:HAD superfamily hydrolase (TIGR01509 family)